MSEPSPGEALGVRSRQLSVSAPDDPFEAASAACVVMVEGHEQGSRGTGFFVAPDLVATCAHVAGSGRVTVRMGSDEDARAEVLPSASRNADVALVRTVLRLNGGSDDGATTGPTFATLDRELPSLNTAVAAFGFPYRAGAQHWDRVAGVVEQLDHQHPSPQWRGEARLIKFSEAWVVPGFSGAPLLNCETGLVCGLVTTTLDASNKKGGLAAPAHLLLKFVEVAEAQAKVTPAPIPCPYPGLPAFGAEQERFFFGRHQETTRVVEALAAGERQVLIVGPSGSGKSSLIAAGIIPRLATRSPGIRCVGPVRLTQKPVENLRAALGGEEDVATQHTLICIDQLEELFTRASRSERDALVVRYREFIQSGHGSAVLGLRADFLGELLESSLWSVIDGRCLELKLAPLKGSALAQAIEEPARRVGIALDPRLTESLIEEAGQEPGALPLLQAALTELWSSRVGKRISLSAYVPEGASELGGLARAIERIAGAALRRLSADQQRSARKLLLRLVDGSGKTATRRRQPLKALRDERDNPTDFEAAYRELLHSRLLTADNAIGTNECVVDLAHESLIWAWPTLATWIQERAVDWLRRSRLETRASEWTRLGRRGGTLDAVELAEAEQWLASDAAQDIGYDAAVVELLRESRAAVAAQRRRELRVRRLAFAGSVIFIAVVSVLALRERGARRESERRRNESEQRGDQLTEEREKLKASLTASHLEQGRELVAAGQPQRALPYLVAARHAGVDGPAIRVLLSQSDSLPLATFAHQGRLRSVQFSPDGERVVTASMDFTSRVWDARTGDPISPLLKHQAAVQSALFSADGKRVVTASDDGTARIWDARTGDGLVLQHAGRVASAELSPDGRRVVTGAGDGAARVWDASTGELLRTFWHDDFVSAAHFSPNGQRVVTASGDHTARVWHAHTGKPISPPLQHMKVVNEVHFSPDGKRVVTASEDATARIWDARTGAKLSPPLKHTDSVWSAEFSPDGRLVVTGSWDNSARVWNGLTGEPISAPMLHQAGNVWAAHFSPDGTRVITASTDHTARIWDALTGMPDSAPFEHRDLVWSAQFSPDGRRVATASYDKTVSIWDAQHGNAPTLRLRHQLGLYPKFSSLAVNSAHFSPDGTRIVTGSELNAFIWNSRSGEQLLELEHAGGGVSSARFSHDGSHVVTASDDKTARVWNADTGELRFIFQHRDQVHAAEFSRDGTRIVTASYDATAQLWDAEKGTPTSPPLRHEDYVYSATFSPDSMRVVTASKDKSARLWDVRSGEPIGSPMNHESEVRSVQFSADGKLLVTACGDSARVWDGETGEPVSPPLNHHGEVFSAQFSPDSTRVITASEDFTARIWDARTGRPVAAPLEHQTWVHWAQFSGDGNLVLTTGYDYTVRVWDASTGKPITPPLEDTDAVWSAEFSPKTADRIVTASRDGTARVWTLVKAVRSTDEWSRIGERGHYELVDDVLHRKDSAPDPRELDAAEK